MNYNPYQDPENLSNEITEKIKNYQNEYNSLATEIKYLQKQLDELELKRDKKYTDCKDYLRSKDISLCIGCRKHDIIKPCGLYKFYCKSCTEIRFNRSNEWDFEN